MDKRLKMVRVAKKMTQAQFAYAIGMGQSTLAMLENGSRRIRDRHIKAICFAFSVNERWLREGEGEMFNRAGEDELFERFAKVHDLDETSAAIMRIYATLEPEKRATLHEIIVQMDDAARQAQQTQSQGQSGVNAGGRLFTPMPGSAANGEARYIP